MFAITDYIILIAFLFFAYRGAKKGILKTFFGPISLIVASVASYTYYQKTGNLKYSLGIAILGPFLLNILVSLIISLAGKLSKSKIALSPVSQFFGALLNVSWSGTLFLAAIFLVTLIPINNATLIKSQNDIATSKIYGFVDKIIAGKMSESRDGINTLTQVLQNPEKIKALQSTKEFKDIYKNEKFKEILKDEELLKQLQEKDIQGIASNPKIMEILKDKEFLKQLMELNKKAISKN